MTTTRCRSERSYAIREASRVAQSKNPETDVISNARKRERGLTAASSVVAADRRAQLRALTWKSGASAPRTHPRKLGLHSLLKNSLCRAHITSAAKAAIDFAELMARLEAAPFQNRVADRVFQQTARRQRLYLLLLPRK